MFIKLICHAKIYWLDIDCPIDLLEIQMNWDDDPLMGGLDYIAMATSSLF